MALAIDASTPAMASNTSGVASITTASFTPPSGSLIVLLMVSDAANSTQDTTFNTPTNTGTAITWTLRARKNLNAGSTGGAGRPAGAEIWTGVGNGGAITVTVGNSFSTAKHLQAMVLTGADTTSANVAAASSSSGLASTTVAGCAVGSYVFAASSDWNALGAGTVGTGQTKISEDTTFGLAHFWRTTSTLASAGSQTMNLTAPAGEDFNIVALEVLAAGTGGTNGTVNAVKATVSDAAVAPAVSGGGSVTAVAATDALAANAPVVSGGATVTAVVATATTAALAPTLTGGASVTGVAAAINAAAIPPASVGVVTTVNAVVATASLAAPAPVVAVNASVTAVAATVAISALAPAVGTPDGQIVAVAARLNLQAYAPVVSAAARIYVFRTPGFVKHYRDKDEPLIVRIPIPTPYSILKVNGFYQQVILPTDEEVQAADIAYLGGRDYQISSTERDALVAAGYGSYIITQEVT